MRVQRFAVLLEAELSLRGLDGAALVGLLRCHEREEACAGLDPADEASYDAAWERALRCLTLEEHHQAGRPGVAPEQTGCSSCSEYNLVRGWCGFYFEPRPPRGEPCEDYRSAARLVKEWS